MVMMMVMMMMMIIIIMDSFGRRDIVSYLCISNVAVAVSVAKLNKLW